MRKPLFRLARAPLLERGDKRRLVSIVTGVATALLVISVVLVAMVGAKIELVASAAIVTFEVTIAAALTIISWSIYRRPPLSLYRVVAGPAFVLIWKAFIPVIADIFRDRSFHEPVAAVGWWSTWWFESIGWLLGLVIVAWGIATWPRDMQRG